MAASIVKTVQVRVLASPNNDPTTATIAMDRWLYIEAYLVIITASIPCLRSLAKSSRQRSNGNRSNSHELGSPYTGNSRSTFDSKVRTSQKGQNYIRHVRDEGGSSDNILERDHNCSACMPDSGIVKRVDISIGVDSLTDIEHAQ